MKRLRIRPSKSASVMSMIFGIVFVGIGLFVAIPIFGAFGIFWTLVAAVIAVFHAVNVFSERGLATTEIDFEGNDFLGQNNAQLPFDERFRRLEQLRKEDLITEQEYQQKRQSLMNTHW